MMRIVGIWLARVGTVALARPSRAQLGSYMRLDGLFERKEKREHSAAPRSVLHTNRPMMPVDDLRHDGKPQPHSGFLGGHKRVENLFAQFFGNSGTGVAQAEFHTFAIVLKCGLDVDA